VTDVNDAARLDMVQVNRLIVTLLLAGDDEQALELYRSRAHRPGLSDLAAAGLLVGGLTRGLPLSEAERHQFLGQVLAVDPETPRFRQFARQLDTPDFATSELGRHLIGALGARVSAEGRQGADALSEERIRLHVAQVLELEPALIQLGADLLANGSFEPSPTASDLVAPSAGSLRGWTPDYGARSDPTHFAAFTIGVDRTISYDGAQSVRLDGFDDAGEPANHADLAHDGLLVQRGEPYVFSVVYRTAEDRRASVWLSDNPSVLLAGNHDLPATGGSWRRLTIVGWNRSDEEAVVRPLLRLWDEGSVWFDDVSLYPLRLAAPVAPRDAVAYVGEP
jgi:hypothetical protein